jgi:tryptophan synthase alpha chain
VELFCETCQKVGIDGLIIPDMPLWEYENKWKSVFEKYDLFNVFLVTPQTQPERIRKIDSLSESFIYLVSSASVTGAKAEVSEKQLDYFQRIKKMELKSPTLIGFGISNHATFSRACTHAQGAIVGSAFIQALEKTEGLLKEEKSKAIYQFVQKIKQPT